MQEAQLSKPRTRSQARKRSRSQQPEEQAEAAVAHGAAAAAPEQTVAQRADQCAQQRTAQPASLTAAPPAAQRAEQLAGQSAAEPAVQTTEQPAAKRAAACVRDGAHRRVGCMPACSQPHSPRLQRQSGARRFLTPLPNVCFSPAPPPQGVQPNSAGAAEDDSVSRMCTPAAASAADHVGVVPGSAAHAAHVVAAGMAAAEQSHRAMLAGDEAAVQEAHQQMQDAISDYEAMGGANVDGEDSDAEDNCDVNAQVNAHLMVLIATL